MKKILSLILVLCMFLCICIPAFATNDKTLKFNEDGTFKIFVVNDIQDDENVDQETIDLLRASLSKERGDRPDLVILNGDQLSDIEFNLGTSGYEKTIHTICDIIEEAQIPFLFTYGNHDNDKSLVFPISKQAKVYNSYNYCFAANNGPDSGTYNNIVYGSDGKTMKLNIYMMNTGAWDLEGWLSGVTPCQQKWYRNTRDALAKANGGQVVPSIVFQHIPVKETYNVLKEVNPLTTPNAIRGNFFGTAYKAYVLDPDKLVKHPADEEHPYGTPQSAEEAVFASAICSEHPFKYTGQFASWLEKGDVFAAFFAHDHKNNFISKEQGIVLAYNRGFGFATEGDGDKRGGRMLVFNEKDITNFDFYNVTYKGVFPDRHFEDTEGGIGFIANNLLQTIRAKIADTFFSFLYPRAA